MKFWAGVTDNRWFEFLSTRGFEEVNFWQPSAKPLFSNLPVWTPFLFKLKRPHNHIAGGGFFVKYSSLPLALAWDAFGERNGAATFAQLESGIRPLARDPRAATFDIGCTVIAQPFFFDPQDWIPIPESWSANIVRGKTYDTDTVTGRELWTQVEDRLSRRGILPNLHDIEKVARTDRYGHSYLTQGRLGQGAFRLMVMDAYERRCAITGETTLLVLEAAHIRPFAEAGPNATSNGLLLRSDFHKLFDCGLLTVTPDLRVKVSSQIRERWYNGKAYYRLHDQPLAVIPQSLHDRPATDFLAWHSQRFIQ